MFIRDFNQQNSTKIDKINKFLNEQFGMTIKGFPEKEKLIAIKEMSEKALVKLRGTSKKFQLEPEYAKYLGIKDVIDTMLAEGRYAKSDAFNKLIGTIEERVRNLMDSGCTMEEAATQCMNEVRLDSSQCYEDSLIQPYVLKAAKDYYESSCGTKEAVEEVVELPETDLKVELLNSLAEEIGIELTDPSSIDAIEEKLGTFAEVTGKSRDSIVGFLNALEEDKLPQGIKFFGAKVAESNAFNTARDKAIAHGHSKFEFNGEEFDLKDVGEDDIKRAKDRFGVKKENMFDDIINDMLAEELEGTSVEEAEVVMAVRALADDIQDHVERLGRMVNEDLPAIADQMIHEFGADQAQQFKDSADTVLQAALESSKQAKEGVSQLVGSITGQEPITGLGLGDTAEVGDQDSIDDLALEPEVDVNEPSASGPEEEPLGRAPVEV